MLYLLPNLLLTQNISSILSPFGAQITLHLFPASPFSSIQRLPAFPLQNFT
jgi:hypothetical protein